jgi:predicted P-loop ATPase
MAIALPGINNACREDEKLIPHLNLFCQKDRQITFAFDCDSKWKTVQAVTRAILKIGKILADSGCQVYVAQWRTTDGKGVDDLIASQGIEMWHQVYERRLTFANYEKKHKEKPTKMDFDGLLKFLEVEFSSRLSFDELKHQILLDGKVLTLANELRCWFCEKYKIKTTKEALNDALIYQAQKNSFHPVKKYLEQVAGKVTPIAIDDLSFRYFGTKDPLYDIFLKRWLIGAVARILKPECKMDYALILQGKQGVGKSTFFNVLGGEWFSDSLGDINSKDALQTLHKFWIHELGEFERITSKKAAGEVKIFLSKTRDDFRIPYGREIQEHPRMCIICGSVNQSSFLVDETGNRRFWIIPIEIEEIDLETLRRERDAIWAGAVQAYQKGEAYDLTHQEKQLCLANNDRFELTDEWQSEVEHYIETRSRVSISEILLNVFGIEIANQDKQTQMRIASILTRLNWYKAGRKQHLGKIQVVWQPRNSQQANPIANQNCKSLIEGVPRCVGVQSDQKTAHLHTNAHLPEEFSNFSAPSKGIWGDRRRYVPPDNAFKPGERVVHEGVVYKVLASTHTHVLLEGFEKSIPIWQVERLED